MTKNIDFESIDMDEICKGCLTHERVGEKIPGRHTKYSECFGYLDKDVDCICKDCLIKGMCDITCEEYRENRISYTRLDV